MGLGIPPLTINIPPLTINIVLESSPPKSTMSLGGLGVLQTGGREQALNMIYYNILYYNILHYMYYNIMYYNICTIYTMI